MAAEERNKENEECEESNAEKDVAEEEEEVRHENEVKEEYCEEEVRHEKVVNGEVYLNPSIQKNEEDHWMLVAKAKQSGRETKFKEKEEGKQGQWVLAAKRSGRVPKGNEQWNMNPDVQRQLKGKMPESTITQWESVRGCVNRIKGNRAYDDGNQAYDRAYVGNWAYDDGQRAYDDGQSGNQAYDRAYGGNHAYNKAYDGNNAEENEIVI